LIAPPDISNLPAPGTPGARHVIARFHREPDDLLSEFATTGGQDCFEEIVRRYGAMVLNVCRQVTGHRQDAEDATQVVFLVLAERLRAGEKIISPGRWLQQVARRAALDIRRSRSRRRRRERQQAKAELIHPPEVNDDSAARLVREELDRVPAKYRIPLVLHYFNGQTFTDAARELGIKPSTLGVRLFRGRKLLAARLARRGVTLSTVALATLLAAVIRKSISDALVKSISQLSLKGGTSAGAGPLAMGSKGLAGLAGSYSLKLALTAGLLAAAAVGARAAVQWHSDSPLLDFHNLLPSFPDLRTHLPHFRADAGDLAPKAVDGSTKSDRGAPANPYENWVVVPHGHSPTNNVQPAIPAAPVQIAQPSAASKSQLSPQLFKAPPAVAHHDSANPLTAPPLQDKKIVPNVLVPSVAPGRLALNSPGAPNPTPTPVQSGGKLMVPSISPRNAAGMAPNGPQNVAPLNGDDDSSGNRDDNSDLQSSLFGPNSQQGPVSSDPGLGPSLSDGGTSVDMTLLGSSANVDPPASVVTPEPAGVTILVTAAAGLLLRRRRKI
jgi:RNA polymerase sigma factor (sigma-70 family)